MSDAAQPAPAATPDPAPRDLLRHHPLLVLGPDGLAFDGVKLAALADALGTPTWVYSAGTLERRYAAFAGALAARGLSAEICYAMKANANRAVIAALAAAGAGLDIVSEGELRIGLSAGMQAGRTVFAGVGKTAREIGFALDAGIRQFNVESAEELAMIAAIAAARGVRAPVALRVNPDVDAVTHTKITTGRAGDKFGIAREAIPALYAEVAANPALAPAGLAMHIGSQITGLAGYRAAYARLADLARELLAQGMDVPRLDLGGGIGIPYRDQPVIDLDGFADAVAATVGKLGLPLIVEPGRWLVGPAGVLLAGVVLEKVNPSHRFVILDAGMNDLIRPSMYDAWHGIVPVAADAWAKPFSPAEVVGPVCESSDRFARGRMLPALGAGARVVFLDAGAYGSVMSSTYNGRPLAAEAMVKDGRWTLVRDRQSYEALTANERLPDWLSAG